MKTVHRWSLYASAALLTAAAMAWVDHRPVDDLVPTVSARPVPARSSRSPQAPAPAPAPTPDRWQLPRRAFEIGTDDPFAPGETAPAVELASRDAQATPPPAPPPAPMAPPLPFSYIGQWQENGHTVAFLTSADGNNLAAKTGATLEGSYRVERVDGDGIVLRYLPLNQTQTLSFADARAAAPAGPQAPPAAPMADIEETN